MVSYFLSLSLSFSNMCLFLDVLITIPNRLFYMLNQQDVKFKLDSVEWLIIDEADKLFEDGKQSFREQLSTIYL